MTPLKAPLNRQVMIGKTAYALTIDPEGLKLVLKGNRKGMEIAWRDLVIGNAAMAAALHASLDLPSSRSPPQPKRRNSR